MNDGTAVAPRARYAAIQARLEEPSASDNRDAIKTEIIALVRQVDAEIAQLTTLRDDVKVLVARWKALPIERTPSRNSASASDAEPTPGAEPGLAPAFPCERPPMQADHLGASTFIEKGWNLIARGQPADAEQTLRKALALAPDDPQTGSLLGWAQMLQTKYDDALLSFQKVLMREPGNALARINVGYICLKKRIFGEAIEHLSRAIRSDTDRKAALYAHFYLGLVYAEREMYDDAQSFYRKTLTLGPNLIEAYYELGRALWFGGKRDDALQAWRDGLAANRFNPWGKRCGEMVELVEGGGEPPRAS
ncbi:MAG TPA: tetratricopeptide repeat protein [Gemmatimonadaceae bacterium]|nr:tetratricopeptide repeat protein [Gemmatimonadaceae bacterium]